MLQIWNERHGEIGSVYHMVDVIVLVRRLFDDLLDRMHGRVDDGSSDPVVTKHVAAVAYGDFVSVGRFGILDSRAGSALECTAL